MLWHLVAEISSVIANDIAISITVPIIVSFLSTTSVCVDVLSSALKIQYKILLATTHKLDTDKTCNDLNGNMYTLFWCCLIHKSTILEMMYGERRSIV